MFKRKKLLKDDKEFKCFTVFSREDGEFRLTLTSHKRVESYFGNKEICNFVLPNLEIKTNKEILYFINKTRYRVK